MTRFRRSAPVFATIALTTTLMAVSASAAAQPQAPKSPAAAAAPTPVHTVVIDGRNAEETRRDFIEVMRKYPPSLGRMLKLDPGLMSNPQYMSAYPGVAQFIAQHPEVVRTPAYFFEEFHINGLSEQRLSERDRAIDMWRSTMGDLLFLIGFATAVSAIFFVLKSIIDHRRWGRLSKIQAEVHNKLIDRLASNDEMLAYIQSPAGAGFLKAGPAGMGDGAKSIHAPFGRILWSAQVGVVLLTLGFGLRWVRIDVGGGPEANEMLHFFGTIAQALGVGFLVSSALSYVLSRRMGLISGSTSVSTERDTPSRS